MRWLSAAVLGLCAAASTLRCSGNSDPVEIDAGGGPTACETANQKLCDKACNCSDKFACAFTDPVVGGSATFESKEACVSLMVTNGCAGEGNPAIDYAKCEKELEDAECIQEPSQQALALLRPDACYLERKDAGGSDAASDH